MDPVSKIYKLFIWNRKNHFNCDNEDEDEDEEEVKRKFVKIPIQNKFNNNEENIVVLLILAKIPLPNNPIVIFGHGNGEDIDYYYNNFVQPLYSHGLSICIVDYRGYGYSDGKYGTASITEREDVIEVYKYLKSQGFEKVSYFGRSLGATCGIFLAAEFPDLVCIALDSPWLSTEEWNRHLCQYIKISEEDYDKLLPNVYEKILKKTNIKFDDFEEPRNAASKITQPLFLIHGTYDHIVPTKNSEELINLVQSKEKQYKPFEGDHNDFRYGPFRGM